MLDQVRELVDEIEATRAVMLRRVEGLTPEQARWRAAPESWSVTEVLEHLVWAEHSGLNKMAVALEEWRRGSPVWVGTNDQRGESIDDIVRRTWRPKEKAPPIAEPKWGGPLPYWLAFFRSCRPALEEVAERVREDELDEVVFPHFLSGPLTLRQRLEFIRFHIQHHGPQVDAIQNAREFPGG